MPVGGTAPISKSLTVPPPNAVTNDTTSSPSRSNSPRIPASAPSTAKTNVPTRSTASSTTSCPYFGNQSRNATTAQPSSQQPHSRTGHTLSPPTHAPSRRQLE